MDSRRAPGGILLCHEVDCCADLFVDPSPTPGNARAKTPVESKSNAVPSYDGFRLDDEERALPSLPERRKSYPEKPVAAHQMWARMLAFEHRKLLAEGKDLQTKIVAGNQERTHVRE